MKRFAPCEGYQMEVMHTAEDNTSERRRRELAIWIALHSPHKTYVARSVSNCERKMRVEPQGQIALRCDSGSFLRFVAPE